MRVLAVILLIAPVACHKEREAPGAALAAPSATEASGTGSPPLASAPPRVLPRRTVQCKSPDGKYRVDLEMEGAEVQPRKAHVLAGGPDAHAGGSGGVSFGGGFPPPGELTCRPSGDPARTGCYVEGTADYGYIVDVSLGKDGTRTIELRQNGVASHSLTTLGCDG